VTPERVLSKYNEDLIFFDLPNAILGKSRLFADDTSTVLWKKHKKVT